jgi:hypothetical protein
MATIALQDPADGVVTVRSVVDPTTDGIDHAPAFGRRASAVGAAVAFGVAAVPGLIGLWQQDWTILVPLSVFGAPSAAVLGWRLADRTRRGSRGDAFDLAIAMGFAAWFLGIALYSVLSVFSALAGDSRDPAMFIGVFVIFVFGCIFMSPALLITIPSAAVWVVVMRRLPEGVLRSSRSTP